MEKQQKIIVATGTYPPEISGQAYFIANFIKYLPSNIKTKIITYSDNEILVKDIISVKRNFYRHFKYYLKLKNQIKSANIIYAQDLISSGLPAALAKNKHNKLVLRLGGDFLWERMINSGKCNVPLAKYYKQAKSIKEKIYLIFYKFVLRRADQIIFNTQYQADLYHNFFKLPQSKISVINNPIEINFNINNSSQSATDEIIFAGRFIPVKNLIRLINVFKKIKTDKKLILIGGGPQKNELIKLSQSDSRINIEDNIFQEKLWHRLAQSYLFILPSLTDLNPSSVLEALALNKPIILTQENGLPAELQKSFKLINPVSDLELQTSIEYFLDENNYQHWLNSLNINFTNYTWQKNIQQHLDIFNKL